MNALSLFSALDGAMAPHVSDRAWVPTGPLAIEGLRMTASSITFDLLIPTGANDVWDYIWRSEREGGSTEKVQLFQGNARIAGSRVSSVRREGAGGHCDSMGPERYRLTFTVPSTSLAPDKPAQVRFFWDNELMAQTG